MEDRKEIRGLSSFKYKHRVNEDKFFDKLYDGAFGAKHFILASYGNGVIYIYDGKNKKHIASLKNNVLYTDDEKL